MGRGRRRGIGGRLLSAGLAAAIALSLAGCSGPLAGIRNPFAKKEEILPGERIPVITDPSLANVDPVLAGKPFRPFARSGGFAPISLPLFQGWGAARIIETPG